MTITERRKLHQEQFPGLDLPTVCLKLRAGLRDGIDGLDELRRRDALALLAGVLETWTEPYHEDEGMDEPIRSLVRATLAYAAERGENPPPKGATP